MTDSFWNNIVKTLQMPVDFEKFTREELMSPNVLADRYASIPMLYVFSPQKRVEDERDLWIAVMKAQSELGLNITDQEIADYEKAKGIIDFDSMRQREFKLKHSEKAKIEEFNALAGHQQAHRGMTSRDQTDNIEQMQVRNGLVVVRDRMVAVAARHARHALENIAVGYADRTHNAIAQASIISKIFSNFGEEFLISFDRLEDLIEDYPLRGIKGAIGTQTDQLSLLKDREKVSALDQRIAQHLGFNKTLNSVGQVYPRSLDFEVVSRLYQTICGPSSAAMTLRLMAGQEQFTEGFKEGQVGSTAMPYKMNSRTLERLKAIKEILTGHLTMAMNIAGEQWYSGDVSDSATRRVFLPDSFFAVDGFYQAYLTALDECGFYPARLSRETDKYLPFLASTRFLMVATNCGIGREIAHRAIEDHSVAVALEMREQGRDGNDLIDRLAKDTRLGLPKARLEEALATPLDHIGLAPEQVKTFLGQVQKVVDKYPEQAKYKPEPIL